MALLLPPFRAGSTHVVALRPIADAMQAFDRWNMRRLRPWLIKAGFSELKIENYFMEFGQGTASMTPALRELEEKIQEKE